MLMNCIVSIGPGGDSAGLFRLWIQRHQDVFTDLVQEQALELDFIRRLSKDSELKQQLLTALGSPQKTPEQALSLIFQLGLRLPQQVRQAACIAARRLASPEKPGRNSGQAVSSLSPHQFDQRRRCCPGSRSCRGSSCKSRAGHSDPPCSSPATVYCVQGIPFAILTPRCGPGNSGVGRCRLSSSMLGDVHQIHRMPHLTQNTAPAGVLTLPCLRQIHACCGCMMATQIVGLHSAHRRPTRVPDPRSWRLVGLDALVLARRFNTVQCC